MSGLSFNEFVHLVHGFHASTMHHDDVPYISAYLVANVRLAIAEAVKTSPAFWSSLNFFLATRLHAIDKFHGS